MAMIVTTSVTPAVAAVAVVTMVLVFWALTIPVLAFHRAVFPAVPVMPVMPVMS
ncbi:hypothetical protein GH825_29875, partial [Bacillus thuringiensis]|nr:hypothetical protein [Bacillus thuringiensis]